MSLDINLECSLTADVNAFYKMVKSTHLFRSLAYVEHLKLMPPLSAGSTHQDMIDNSTQLKKQTNGSLSSPSSGIKQEIMQAGSRTSQQTMSPTQLSHKSSDSPVPRTLSTRSNSSPASNFSAPAGPLPGRLSPHAVLRPLEIQSPNSINMQLPPTCGAKQLAKLKRFLTTLQQFGSDISTDIGERVRALVLALVNSQLSIEDFHAKLQETTNFPLKPFVIPFLKATLPSLQRELLQCAQVSRQTPQQYLANNERVIFDTACSTESKKGSNSSISPEFREDPNHSNKRKLSPKATSSISEIPPPKRLLRDASPNDRSSSRSPPHTILTDVESGLLLGQTEKRLLTEKDLLLSPSQIKLEDITRMFRARLENADFSLVSSLRQNSSSTLKEGTAMLTPPVTDAKEDDNWKRVKVMLGDVASLVEKTKSAMSALQESRVKETQEFSLWMRRHAEGIDQDFKKRTGEIMTQTIRQSEDRIAEVKRRADEMVSEVKRQAIVEIHQAVTAAELKANELVGQERLRMENVLSHIKKTSKEEALRIVNKQSDLPENCWNCGRKASETCSGCNKARYCGQFCQHKDWDRHHTSCGAVKDKTDNNANIAIPTKVIETKKEKD